MTYEIKPVTEQDKKWSIGVAAKSMLEDEVGRADLYSVARLSMLFNRVVKDETGLICWKDGKRVGMVGGILLPHHLKPNCTVLTELVWYIDPEHRRSRASLKLLNGYKQIIDEKADEGIFTLLSDTPIEDSSMERMGFKPYERNFIYRKE